MPNPIIAAGNAGCLKPSGGAIWLSPIARAGMCLTKFIECADEERVSFKIDAPRTSKHPISPSYRVIIHSRWLSRLTTIFLKIATQNKNQSNLAPWILQFLLLILLFCTASTVNAASFDCTKAVTHVEKLICSNAEISELDSEVDVDYRKAVDKTSNELRTDLIKQQKHWLKFMRNRCSDELCLKHAYWAKLAELETFFIVNNLNTHGPTHRKSPYKNEAEKLEPIKQILATTKMYAASHQPAFCQKIFDDLKQMKDISFLEAKVKTSSYEDAALDPWKQHCKSGQSLNFGHVCSSKVVESDDNCFVMYGEQPFKIFEMPTQTKKKKRYILYMESAYGPMNIKYAAERRGGDVAGFHELDAAHCKVEKHWNAPIAEPSHYNSIIKHKDDYYFVVLNKSNVYCSLSIGSIDSEDKYCRWSTTNSNPSPNLNSGEK